MLYWVKYFKNFSHEIVRNSLQTDFQITTASPFIKFPGATLRDTSYPPPPSFPPEPLVTSKFAPDFEGLFFKNYNLKKKHND